MQVKRNSGSAGMAFLVRWGYAVSDLWFRRNSTLLNVLAMTIPAIYILVAGSIGVAIHRHQKKVLEDSLPTLVVASCADVTDASRRFTVQKVEEIGRLPGVALAYPRLEISVKLSLDGSRLLDAPAEGTVPGDPSLSGTRMEWGRAPCAERRDVALSRPLFEKLGGMVGPDPRPPTVCLQVTRTVGGKEEVQRFELAVAGLLRHQPEEKAYIPLDLAVALDKWCTGKLERLPGTEGEEECEELTYPCAFAFAPAEQVGRVPDEAAHLDLAVKRAGEVESLEADGDVWARLDSGVSKGASFPAGLPGPAFRVHIPRSSDRLPALRIVALSSEDPRWRLCKESKPPAFGFVIAREGAVGSPIGPRDALTTVSEVLPAFPVDGDFACSTETLRWLAFDSDASLAIRTSTILTTRDLTMALRLETDFPGKVESDVEEGWFFLTAERALSGAPHVDAETAVVRVRESVGGDNLGEYLIARTTIREVPPGGDEIYCRPERVKARILPDRFFDCLDDTRGPRASLPPCILVDTEKRKETADRIRVDAIMCRVARRIIGPAREVWLPVRSSVLQGAEKGGIVGWGDSTRLLPLAAGVIGIPGHSLDSTASSFSKKWSIVFQGGLDAARRHLGPSAASCELREIRGVPCTLSTAEGEDMPVLAISRNIIEGAGAPQGSGDDVLLSSAVIPTGEVILTSCGWSSRPLKTRALSGTPSGFAAVGETVFRALLFHAERDREGTSRIEERIEMAFTDPLQFRQAAEATARASLALRPIVPLRQRRLVKYEIRDLKASEGAVKGDVVSIVAMSRPTFVDAVPQLALDVELPETGGIRLSLRGTKAGDPSRFEVRLEAGSWLVAGMEANAIVLPVEAAARIAGGSAAAAIGRTLEVRLEREAKIASSESVIVLPFRIVGVVSGPAAWAPLAVLSNLELWRRGKVVYSESLGEFRSPLSMYEGAGYVRCNLHARSIEETGPLVERLESMGYETKNSLAEQEGLRSLGGVLGFAVAFFVGGCVLLATLFVLHATLMNVRSKIWEIAILRAHGVGSRDILSIFALQGFLLGGASFVAATLFFAVFGRGVDVLVGRAFSVPVEVLSGSVGLGLSPYWLIGLVFVVAIGSSLLGVIPPALGASRVPPVQALRSRE